MKKKTKKKIIPIILILLVVFSGILIWQLGFLPFQLQAGGKGIGSASINYIDTSHASVIISASDCIGNPRGHVQVCSGEMNDIDIVLEGWEVDGIVTWTIDNTQYTTTESTLDLTGGDYFCICCIGFDDGTFCNWKAEFNIIKPSATTTTTIRQYPDGEGTYILLAIIVLVLVLVASLFYFKIIKL